MQPPITPLTEIRDQAPSRVVLGVMYRVNMKATHRLATLGDAKQLFEQRRKSIIALAPKGMSLFGVNLTRVPRGQWTSQRHWHTAEDEFVCVTDGEVVLINSRGEEVLRAGDCAGFVAGVADDHHFQNRSDREAV